MSAEGLALWSMMAIGFVLGWAAHWRWRMRDDPRAMGLHQLRQMARYYGLELRPGESRRQLRDRLRHHLGGGRW